jgi:hypothetical protein
MMANSEGSDKEGHTNIHRRTKSLVDLAEARTVVVAPIETTICVSGIAMVDWDIGVNKVTLMGCQSAVVRARRVSATYQEQHELGRHDTLTRHNSRPRTANRGFRPVCPCSGIVFEGHWTLCRAVNRRRNSRSIDDGGLSEEVISKQVKSFDSAIIKGGVREVGFET